MLGQHIYKLSSLHGVRRATLNSMTWFGYAVLCAFVSSLSAIVEKKTLAHVHAMDFSIALALVAGILSAPILFTSSWVSVTVPMLMLSFLVSILAAFAFIGVTRGVKHLDISTSSSLFLLSPFMTTILAFILLGESLSLLQFGGILLIGVGTYILETTHTMRFREFLHNMLGDRYTRYILIGLLLYSFCALGDRIILGRMRVDPKLYVAIIQLFLAIEFIGIALYYRGGIGESLRVMQSEWKKVLMIGILTTGYRWMQSEATALAAIGLVIAVKRSSTLFTTLIGGGMLHEKELLRKSIACLIMICGVYLIALK